MCVLTCSILCALPLSHSLPLPSLATLLLHPQTAVWVTDGYRVEGRWAGEKGNPAGFRGRLAEGGKTISGHWYDLDAGVLDRDHLAITLTLGEDGGSYAAVAASKAGSDVRWEAVRPTIKREGGKIVDYGYRSKAVFDRLTADAAGAHAAWAETEREALLAASIREAAALRSVDGAITYIPPLAVCDAYDDSALRRHQRQSRHGGKQLLTSTHIIGQTVASGKVPPVAWEPSPYLDTSGVRAALRKAERARVATTVPAGLLARKAFRPTSGTSGLVSDKDAIYVSTLVDAELGDDEMRKMASAALKVAPEALTGGTGHLVRTADGKLDVVPGKKNVLVGHAHWTRAAEAGLEHLPDDYDGARKDARADFLASKKRLAGRPPFSPAASAHARLAHAAGHAGGGGGGEEAAPPASPPRSAPAAGGAGAGAGAGGGKTDRPPFNANTHYDPARFSKFPEFMPCPVAGGAADRLRAAGKLGRAAEAAAAAAAAAEGKEARPPFSPSTPAMTGRMMASVAMHPANLAAARALASPL